MNFGVDDRKKKIEQKFVSGRIKFLKEVEKVLAVLAGLCKNPRYLRLFLMWPCDEKEDCNKKNSEQLSNLDHFLKPTFSTMTKFTSHPNIFFKCV